MTRPEVEATALMGRCLDGTATSDDIQDLDCLLRTGGPLVVRAVARAVRFEGSLEDAVCTGASVGVEMTERASYAHRRWVRFAGGACAAGLCAVAAFACFWLFAGRSPHSRALPAAARLLSVHAATSEAAPPSRPPPKRLEIADGSTVTFQEGEADLAVERVSPTRVVVRLSRGQARFDVAPRPERRFRVYAGAVKVEVLGTAFTVDRSTSGAVAVRVERGLVNVTSPGVERRLRAGEEDIFHEGPATESPATEPIDKIRPQPRRPVPAGPPGTSSGALQSGQRPTSESEDAARALLKTAVNARVGGKPAQAATALRTIVDKLPGDPRAPYAAFMLGHVLLDDLDRPLEAAETFASVRRLDPNTPLAEDALAREIEAWSRGGRVAVVQERARLFLSQFPNGVHAKEIRAIVGVR